MPDFQSLETDSWLLLIGGIFLLISLVLKKFYSEISGLFFIGAILFILISYLTHENLYSQKLFKNFNDNKNLYCENNLLVNKNSGFKIQGNKFINQELNFHVLISKCEI